MKILFIDGNADYHFTLFEQSDYSVEYIVKLCEKSESKKISIDEEDVYFDAELMEFGEVDEKFIEFIKNKQDHDYAKHSNFVVVPN